MLHIGYMFLADVDYLVEIVFCFTYAPCHDHLVLICIRIGPQASCTPLMSIHASYRLAGERGGTRRAGGDAGAGTSGRIRAGRRFAGVPGPQA